MAKTRKADKAAEDAQEGREVQGSSSAFQADDRSGGLPAAQDMSQDAQEGECVPGGVQEGAETVQEGDIPRDPYEELMEPDPVPEGDAQPFEYAVAGCNWLRLRAGPSLDAPVITKLPQGAGVSDTGERQGEWWEVVTGRLEGWVMAEYLEPVWY